MPLPSIMRYSQGKGIVDFASEKLGQVKPKIGTQTKIRDGTPGGRYPDFRRRWDPIFGLI